MNADRVPRSELTATEIATFATLLLAMTVSLAGCNKGTRLSGAVFLDGKPMTHGEMTFMAEGMPLVYATIRPDGSYVAKAGGSKTIPPGSYRVSVAAYELILGGDPFHPPERRLTTPAKYSSPRDSGFVVEVKQGPNQQNFELRTEQE